MEAAIYAAALGVAIGTIVALVAKGLGYGKKPPRDNGSKRGLPERQSDDQCMLPPGRNAPASHLHERRVRSRRKRSR